LLIFNCQHVINVECRYAGSEADMRRLVQPRRSLHLIHYMSSVHDLGRSLHDLDVPAALRPRQEEEAYDNEDRTRLDCVLLHCRAALRLVHVGRTP